MAATIVVTSMSTIAQAQDKGAQIPAHDLRAKTDYCKTCHGIDAQGFRGSYPMPRLAGQQPEYIENQLKAFVEHRRSNPVMFNVAHVLSPAMLAALTTEFKNLNPKPLGGAPKADAAEGKKIYEEGVPDANVPPCASCHGPEAKGDGQFPRLASQLYDYVIRKLTNWDKERGQDKANPDSSAIMQPIAHELTPAQIKSVAAYVSRLE
ncbi:cytochrome C [Bradyrhizobium sp. CCBAU 53340]|nr:cytochrome C [Bradyrhizobium sp. CCBAU 53340]